MDKVSKSKRSEIMSRVHGRDTNSEMRVRRALHSEGFRFRLNHDKLPGKPDLVLRKHKTVVLVNGCLWHGHDCHLFKVPGTRIEFWTEKIAGNRVRDQYQVEQLLDLGWRVMVVWECALKGRERLDQATIAEQLSDWLIDDRRFEEIGGLRNSE